MADGTLLHAAMQPPHFTDTVLADNAKWLMTRNGPGAHAQAVLAAARYALTLEDVQCCLAGSEFEVPVSGDLGGMEWQARLDIYDRNGGVIIDIKMCREQERREWVEAARTRHHWTQASLYWHQLALYRRLTGGTQAVAILAIDPSDPPDIFIWELDDAWYPWLDSLADYMAGSVQISWTSPSSGLLLPPIIEMAASDGDDLPRCEQCTWCRKSRTSLFRVFVPEVGRGL